MFLKIYKTLEKAFEVGTKENFVMHEVILVSNIFLLILALLEIFYHTNSHLIHNIEFAFGIFFLVELIISLIFIYIPNKIFFSPYVVLNFLVILTLLAPGIFGNLAVLRLIRSFKIIKIFLLNRQRRKDLEKNPEFKNTIIEKKLRAAEKKVAAVSKTVANVPGIKQAAEMGKVVAKATQNMKQVEEARERIMLKNWKNKIKNKKKHKA